MRSGNAEAQSHQYLTYVLFPICTYFYAATKLLQGSFNETNKSFCLPICLKISSARSTHLDTPFFTSLSKFPLVFSTLNWTNNKWNTIPTDNIVEMKDLYLFCWFVMSVNLAIFGNASHNWINSIKSYSILVTLLVCDQHISIIYNVFAICLPC